MKITIKETCGREFLAYGRIFLKRGQEKEYEDSRELQMLIDKGYVEVVEKTIPKTRRKKKVSKTKKKVTKKKAKKTVSK